jgi:hypothetical protein
MKFEDFLQEAEYHIDQAHQKMKEIDAEDPKGTDRGAQRAKRAWKRLADRESQVPKTKEQAKLYSKGERALKSVQGEKTQKPGKEAHKLAGAARHLKGKYGSKFGQNPEVRRKTDRTMNKMLKDTSRLDND